jgi:hypothetical protein
MDGPPKPPPAFKPADPAVAPPADQSSPIPLPNAVKKWIPIIKTVGPALVALIAAVGAARKGQDEVSDKTDRGYAYLAPNAIASKKHFEAIETSIKQLADTVELQGKLLLAMQPGFTPAGLPAPAPATPLTPAARRKKTKRVPAPADPALVKKVQVQAVKTLAEIQQRAANPAPIVAPVPATIPAQPPPPPTSASATPPQAHEPTKQVP